MEPNARGLPQAVLRVGHCERLGVKRGFVPLREFRSLADANRQLHEWILGPAGNRSHGTTREQPLGRFAVEKGLLTALPTRPPEIASWAQVSVHRDAHVSFATALYSVPFRLIGVRLWLRASASASAVQCFLAHELVATHPRQPPGKRSTVRDHLPPESGPRPKSTCAASPGAKSSRLVASGTTSDARPCNNRRTAE